MLKITLPLIQFKALIAQRGQGMVEYALILSLVSIVAITALTTLGERVSDIFITINNTLNSL